MVYLEELELERERWRLRPGDLERVRRRAGDRLRGDRDLSHENTEIFTTDEESKLPEINRNHIQPTTDYVVFGESGCNLPTSNLGWVTNPLADWP